ncbi:hypothetical protein [Legionella cardiaca]|uniref:Substrate of the Dot/Icm secretion system n=1 Tax=Legionella cardiaca TaxID=1071983 RepID=A0ABY8ARE1_9GAMM|nr:hypothetical protein [Legionella cardiaca]WED43248.1 hypothetical protein PXX05_00285 [Legionella cardiaca]
MHFFKISKKTPQKTTLFTRFSDGPKGNSVVCIAKKHNSEKKIIIKIGDLVGNEYFYDSVYADEIEANEELFAISREGFCGDLIRAISPHCTAKYNRFHGKNVNELFIGSDFMEHFQTWKASYNYNAQTILGYKINSEGDVEVQQGNSKPVRGLGVCAVLLTVLGRGDRGNTNWGLVEYNTHLQVTLIDFGQCLAQFLLFEDETNSPQGYEENIECVGESTEATEGAAYSYGQGAAFAYERGTDADDQGAETADAQNPAFPGFPAFKEQTNSRIKEDSNWLNFTNPFDIINAIFQQYSNSTEPTPDDKSQYVEPPLPSQFLQSQRIKCEIFETIHQLYTTPFSDLVKMANDNFKEFPTYKAAMLQDKKLVIEHLYNQFKDNKEYLAVQFINQCFMKVGTGFKLSDLDNTSINYFLSIYTFLNPSNDSYKEAFFCRQIRTILKREEDSVEMQSDSEQISFSQASPII